MASKKNRQLQRNSTPVTPIHQSPLHVVPNAPTAVAPMPAGETAPDTSTVEVMGGEKPKVMIRIPLHPDLPSARVMDLGDRSLAVFNVPNGMRVHLVNGSIVEMKRAKDAGKSDGIRDMLASFSDKRVRLSGKGVAIFLGPRDYK